MRLEHASRAKAVRLDDETPVTLECAAFRLPIDRDAFRIFMCWPLQKYSEHLDVKDIKITFLGCVTHFQRLIPPTNRVDSTMTTVQSHQSRDQNSSVLDEIDVVLEHQALE